MSTAQDAVIQKDEAKQIWEQLDAEESGRAQPPAQESAPEAVPEAAKSTAEAPANYHNGDEADAPADSDAHAPTSEQALRDKVAGLEALLNQVTQRLRNAEGHIGGLGSQLKQQLQAATQVSSKGGEAPSAGEIRAAQQSPKAMAALQRDYPEFAEAMQAALTEHVQELKAAMPQAVQAPSVTPEDIARMRAEVAVEIRHPGWVDLVQTSEFHGWLKRQAPEVQLLAKSDSPRDAIRLLDLHGEATKSTTSQRTQRLSAAAAIPSGRSGSQTRSKPIEEMTPQELWRYYDEIDKQKGN